MLWRDISSLEILMCSDLWNIYDIYDKKISNLTPSKFSRYSWNTDVYGNIAFFAPTSQSLFLTFLNKGISKWVETFPVLWHLGSFQKNYEIFFHHFLFYSKTILLLFWYENRLPNSISFYYMTLKHIKKPIVIDLWYI